MTEALETQTTPKTPTNKHTKPAGQRNQRKPKIGEDTNRKPHARRAAATSDSTTEFRNWLAGLELGINPNLHINGRLFESAIITVDFGQPIRPVRLDGDQTTELVARMKKLTREIVLRDVNVRINSDASTGIWYASIG